MTARSDVRHFGSIEGFNDDEYGSRALVLRDMFTKGSRQGQAGYDRGAERAVRWQLVLVAVVGVRWFSDLNVIFIIFGVFCTSSELF